MGYRVSANLKGAPYQVSHIEVSEAGRNRLKELGITCVEADRALPEADVVILAIPDNMIEKVTGKLVDEFKQGATLIALDAAAPFAGHLPERADLTIFVAHPCHPPIFNDETDLEAKRDYFGGIKAKQAIVCALLRGEEANFPLAEDVAGTGAARTGDPLAPGQCGPHGDPRAGPVGNRVRHLPHHHSRSHGQAVRRGVPEGLRATSSSATSMSSWRSCSISFPESGCRTRPTRQWSARRRRSLRRTGRRCSSATPSPDVRLITSA